MKYYEYNGKGNNPGSEQLQCPICGEAAVGMIKDKRAVRVLITEDGNVVLSDNGDKVNIKDKTIYCPQCIQCEMIPHSEVEEYHEKEHCPGCPVCGRVDETVFSICRECLMSYGPSAVNCMECAYNYSRVQQGIDFDEMRMNFNIEMTDIAYGHQLAIFHDARRKIYKKQKNILGVPVYEQITRKE